jgi:DNA-binding NarL/FixJ family response regulator
MTPVRIFVADDHAVVRRGLRSLLQMHPGWEVCGEAANGREAVEQVKKLKPAVVILDISMPELNGLDVTRKIMKDAPQTEVLILTMHSSEEVACEVLRAGARGYVLKSDADPDLVTAVEALLQHKPFLSSNVTEFVVDRFVKDRSRPSERQEPRSRLTNREREVLQLLAEGKSNKEVAVLLKISTKTVEAHRANIIRKLDLHSLSDLVRYAIRNKMVEP